MDSYRVLVVDDNQHFAEQVTQWLMSLPEFQSVEWVESGPAALASLKESDANVLLIDVAMPQMDGRELTRILRSRGSQHIIVHTSFQGDDYGRDLAIESGADAFVPKLEIVNSLLNTIRSIATNRKTNTI